MNKVLMAIDTEDDTKGNVIWINFFDGKKHYSFRKKDEAVKFLDNLNSSKYLIWACNLEYDVCNIFDDLSKVILKFGKTRLVSCKYKKCLFYDTINHWSMSVKEMGEYIKYPKLKFNPSSLKYCQRDTEIVYYFVKTMLEKYKEIGIFDIKPTISSISLDFWLKVSKFKLKKIDKEHIEKIKPAYFGGRSECFFIGRVKGDIFYVDVNSMYPFCMLNELPYPYYYQKRFDINSFGITKAKISSQLEIPILPYRLKNGKVIYPNGEFTGIWSNLELKKAVDLGVKIKKIYFSYTYPIKCQVFKEYILNLYEKRKNTSDIFLKYLYKKMMNSLYGKFAQGNEIVVIEDFEKFRKRKKIPNQYVVLNNIVLYRKIGEYPIHSNFIFSIYITAYARIYLYDLIMKIKNLGGEILYCDTDSIIYKNKIDLNFSDNLGDIKLEGVYKEFEAKSCKEYELVDKENRKYFKVKGIPSLLREEYFNNNYVEFKKPLRIKEAIRRNLKPNLWIEYKKAKVISYDKGKVLPDGKVLPLSIYD